MRIQAHSRSEWMAIMVGGVHDAGNMGTIKFQTSGQAGV